MHIIYLDKPSYLPQDAVKQLKQLGTVTIYDDMPSSEEAVKRLSNADIAIVEWTDITSEMIAQLQRIKCIVLVTTGYEFVDINAAKQNNIVVCNTPDYSRYSVAEHVFGLFLALSKHLVDADRLVRQGKDEYTDHVVGVELYDKTLGILGLGSIGSHVAQIGQGFGMKVIGHTRTPKNLPNVTEMPLEETLRSSDFLSLCLSVNPSTKNMLDETKLSWLKPSAFLVNISSNDVLDEKVLAKMLNSNQLAGAGFDHVTDENLLQARNAIFSPGSAWYTQGSLNRNVHMFVDTVFAFANGHPRFIVNH
jgi:glycerate dehydrogenase